ncbi:MAG: SAM-dependent methyltransferase [Planctomycetaceae bacterium]|nr:MAG: SAM-dependent methyltransferase [Planctomycetaceae bacterium]
MATTTAKRKTAEINPLINAEALRQALGEDSVAEHQSQLGQFLSPLPIAEFMASLFPTIEGNVRLLDPGAGIGSLTAAFVEEACGRKRKPVSIDVSAYEVDPRMESGLNRTLSDCAKRCQGVGVRFTGTIIIGDFIETMATKATLQLFEEPMPAFTHVIMNPPYRKIRSNSISRKLLSHSGIETSNLYTAFMALAVDAMKIGGHFVSITPRSFCNGPYFKSFRKAFLNAMHLDRLHLFESRRDAFSDDNVLQENIIVSATRSDERSRDRVAISSSAKPCETPSSNRIVPYDAVVSPSDPDQFIHLAMDDNADAIAARIARMPASLPDIGIAVSTGRVVDFRVRKHLRAQKGPDSVPLIYPCNLCAGGINWPKEKTKKSQAIIDCEETAKQMVDAGIYVLVKRFSTKEEARRVVAAVFDSDSVGCERVGFENHLNFFHTGGSSLGRNIAFGLGAYLNTSTVDGFFRQFNGHTQVNASDLRKLKYPTRDQLISIGKKLLRNKKLDQADVDKIVANEVGWD